VADAHGDPLVTDPDDVAGDVQVADQVVLLGRVRVRLARHGYNRAGCDVDVTGGLGVGLAMGGRPDVDADDDVPDQPLGERPDFGRHELAGHDRGDGGKPVEVVLRRLPADRAQQVTARLVVDEASRSDEDLGVQPSRSQCHPRSAI
jgi:hypothetical protein